MIRRTVICLCALAAAWGGSCRQRPISPMPGAMPSTGLLLKCERVRFSRHLELRRYEMLQSEVSNDFYPLNVSKAVPAGRVLSKLYVWRGLGWQFLDFADLPRADTRSVANLSPDGQRIVYESPDVGEGEGEFPRAYLPGRRTYQAVIYDHHARRKFPLAGLSEVYGLGSASHWRRDGQAVAFSTTCFAEGQPCPQLVVLGSSGEVILSAAAMPELKDLEFISYSPDGRRIAALRPVRPRSGGLFGGSVVEVDVQERSLREVGEIPAADASQNLWRFDRLIEWDSAGSCRLKSH